MTLESDLKRINELLFSQARETNMSHQEREVRLGEALEAQIAAISQLVMEIIDEDEAPTEESLGEGLIYNELQNDKEKE